MSASMEPPQREAPKRYRSSAADIEVLSSDGVLFKVHSYHLIAGR